MKIHTLLCLPLAGWVEPQAWSLETQILLATEIDSVICIHITQATKIGVRLMAFGGTNRQRISFLKGSSNWEGLKIKLWGHLDIICIMRIRSTQGKEENELNLNIVPSLKTIIW